MAFFISDRFKKDSHFRKAVSLLILMLGLLGPGAPRSAHSVEFSFHEDLPRGISGSYWVTEVINRSQLTLHSWLNPPRGCETRLWEETLQQNCRPERQAVFNRAIDDAFQIWQTHAADAVRATGGSAQDACVTSARLLHRDVRGVSAENRDDRILQLTQLFSPSASLPPPPLAPFRSRILEIQGEFAHSVSRYREQVCALPEAERAASASRPLGTTLLDLLVTQKASSREGILWLCSTPPERLIEDVITETHTRLLEYRRRGIEPDFTLDLQAVLGSALQLYFTPGGTGGAISSALIRREANRALGTTCPDTGMPEQIVCACRMALAFAEMDRYQQALTREYADRIERIRSRSQARYLEMIERSDLSSSLREAIRQRYINSYPPLRLSSEFALNAAYSRNERTGEEGFEITLGTLLLPEETVLELFDHENGHFFAYSLESPELQNAITPQDRALLGRVQDCADRSVSLGEFRVELAEGVQTPGRSEHRNRIFMKRDEAIGDLFIRGYRRLHPASAPGSYQPVEGLFCSALRTHITEIQDSIFSDSTETPFLPENGDSHVNDPHSREGWRIPWLAGSLNPTLGERGAAPRAAACERILWSDSDRARSR